MNTKGAVLVTGGAGYVGSHACKALASAGWLPVTYDNLSRGHEWAVKWGPLEVGDIHDRAKLAAVMRKYQPSAVLHFAGFAYVAESMEDPCRYYHNNVAGSVSLLEAMREAGILDIVFSSTCATYGVVDGAKVFESTPQNPINPYGASKMMVERVLADCGRAWDLRAMVLRYFNAAGCDPDGEIGESHDPEPHLIPRIIATAFGHAASVSILGDDYDTPDGTCVRDFVHVSDLARAHVLALDRLKTQGHGGIYNLGGGNGYSVRQVVEAVARVTGMPVRTEIGPRRPGDPGYLVSSAELARQELGWVPQITDLDAMIASAVAWVKRRK